MHMKMLTFKSKGSNRFNYGMTVSMYVIKKVDSAMNEHGPPKRGLRGLMGLESTWAIFEGHFAHGLDRSRVSKMPWV